MEPTRSRHVLPAGHLVSALALATAGFLTLASVAVGASPEPVPDNSTGSPCWTDTPGTLGSIDHPTDPRAIVLRMSVGGGFVPPEVAFMENATFTLYGNDAAIFRPSGSSDSLYDPLSPFACSNLSPTQVDDLLTLALDQGGLADADELYPNPYVADAPATTFSIDADGVQKTVVVQALGFDEAGVDDPEARAGFTALVEVLADFGTQIEASGPYAVPLYRAMLTEAWPELEGTPVAWPWDDLSPDAFGADLATYPTLTPEQVAQVTTVPNGGQTFILVDTPDGVTMSLTLRPLLPDEVAASATSAEAPGASFLTGDQPLVGTTWLLVGYLEQPGGRYVAPAAAAPSELRFSAADAGQRLFDAGTGCLELRGEWSRGPKRSGNPTRAMAMAVWGRDELPSCAPDVVSQDAAVREALGHVGAYTLAVQGPDALGYGLTEADFDAQLWAHLTDQPDLTSLVLRDQSGEALLVYAPLDRETRPSCEADCAASAPGTAESE